MADAQIERILLFIFDCLSFVKVLNFDKAYHYEAHISKLKLVSFLILVSIKEIYVSMCLKKISNFFF
ncbi:hypothetical protein RT99_05295, partial [Flavobacterium sp. MEB061]